MAMILFPDVQEKAHEELNTVLGKGVVPTFNERERLPYLQAIIYELMRWHTVFPLGLYLFHALQSVLTLHTRCPSHDFHE